MKNLEMVLQKESEICAGVTVAISLYNYQQYILEALESVKMQTLPHFDVIIVDDCSTDNSNNIVRDWLSVYGCRFNRYALLKHCENQGLGAARNTAFARATTEFVFVLDADNTIYPRCLERLCSGLSRSDASFAYCYLEKFGDVIGLLGIDSWNPYRLRNGNYIDAMALHRKIVWEQVGGYAEDMPQNGWEDFDFWYRIAEIQGWGVRIPEILARYRVHGKSMLRNETNQAHQALWNYLHEHHPTLC